MKLTNFSLAMLLLLTAIHLGVRKAQCQPNGATVDVQGAATDRFGRPAANVEIYFYDPATTKQISSWTDQFGMFDIPIEVGVRYQAGQWGGTVYVVQEKPGCGNPVHMVFGP